MSRFPLLPKLGGLKFVRICLHLILIEPLKNGRAVTLQNLGKCLCTVVGVRQSVVISIIIQGRFIYYIEDVVYEDVEQERAEYEALRHAFAGVSPFTAVGTQFYPLFPVAQVATDQSTRASGKTICTQLTQ